MKKKLAKILAGVLVISMFSISTVAVQAETVPLDEGVILSEADETQTLTGSFYGIQDNALIIILADNSMAGFMYYGNDSFQQGDEVTVTYIPVDDYAYIVGSVVSISKVGEEITDTTVSTTYTETTETTPITTDETNNLTTTSLTTSIINTDQVYNVFFSGVNEVGDSVFKVVDGNIEELIVPKGVITNQRIGQPMSIWVGMEIDSDTGEVYKTDYYLYILAGDLTGDENVNIADLVKMANILVGNAEAPSNISIADVNFDNNFNVSDLVAFAKLLVDNANVTTTTTEPPVTIIPDNSTTTNTEPSVTTTSGDDTTTTEPPVTTLPDVTTVTPIIYSVDGGVWLAKPDNEDGGAQYYCFLDSGGLTGTFLSLENGTGLGISITGLAPNQISVAMGFDDNILKAGFVKNQDGSITITWESGLIMTLTYESDKTMEEFSFYTNEQLVDLALDYYAKFNDGYTPSMTGCVINDDNTVTIQLYDLVNGNNSTAAWYTVDRLTAKGFDGAGEAIDFTSIAVG